MGKLSTSINNAAVLFSFGFLLLVGLTVNSSQFIDQFQRAGFLMPYYAAAAFVSFTPTNLLCLSVVASYIGQQTSTETQKPIGEAWNRALLAGIIIFVGVFFFGNYLDNTIILQATQKDYCTLAGAVLVAGFGQTFIKPPPVSQ